MTYSSAYGAVGRGPCGLSVSSDSAQAQELAPLIPFCAAQDST